jgi:hypothetical protein
LQREPVTWATARPAAELTRTIQVNGKPMPIAAGDVHPYLRPHVWGDAKRAVVAVLNYDTEKDYDVVIQSGSRTRTVSVPPHGQGVWQLSREP